VRAALELFTTQGYHASTTPQLARKAGVAEGTIYRHFESKEHLLNELYRAALRLLLSFVQEAPTNAPCRDRLQAVAEQWRDLAATDPALVKLVFLTEHGTLLDQRSHAAMADLRSALANVIASGKSAGEVRAGAVEIWTDVWIQLVVLVMERVATGRWTTQHVGARQVTDAAWDAIRLSETGTSPPRLGSVEEPPSESSR
jgi:AcrR family transcriptional regulator